ncbi:MAG: hypothetical protein A3G27_15010 [Betaproteobacteria bacterium RIFCSPLOWO2_12_FULL_66_14]|nr:MAG: hypothetical protein A3G27_15010 [Betaproteobacteria bacterium RIFCSPLOWO2_12_FULL_66_14]
MKFSLDPRTTACTALLGTLSALSALSLDPFLPALPSLVTELDAPVTVVQLTISAFFVGLACGQALYGPFSDHYGRRPPLIFGVTLFLAATLYCANAGSIEGLITGRFFQALGAASGMVLVRSIVRDLYAGDEAAHKMAAIWLVFGLMPMFGPLVGSGLLALWGWQSIFWFMAAFIAPVFAVMLVALPETASLQPRQATTPSALAREYTHLLRQRHFMVYVTLIFFSQVGVFAFVTHSSFVLVTALGFTVGEFGLVYALIMTGHLAGAALGARLARTIGTDATIRRGVLLSFASGLVLMGLAWSGIDVAPAIVLPMLFLMFGFSLIVPHAMAAAMTPFPELAGTASSLIGLAQLSAGAAISYLLGVLFDGTARPMTGAIALSSLAAVVFYEGFIGRSQPHPARTPPS